MSSAQTPASAAQSQSQQSRYPSYDSFSAVPPQLFDIIPHTERLLSRILVPDEGIGGAAKLDQPEHKKSLDIKDLDSAANGIMVQLTRAKTAVANLPGVDRTVEEQEEEIEYLEGRIERQRSMLKTLRDLMVATSDVDMKEK
jgi:RNA polymerase II transcription mediator complex subunit 9